MFSGTDGECGSIEFPFPFLPPDRQIQFTDVPRFLRVQVDLHSEPLVCRSEGLRDHTRCFTPHRGFLGCDLVLLREWCCVCGCFLRRPEAVDEADTCVVVELECAERLGILDQKGLADVGCLRPTVACSTCKQAVRVCFVIA